jgi:HK97 gp10 family phage protein
MTVRMEVENEAEVRAALRRYGAKFERLLDRAINATALEVISSVRRKIQRGPKTGIVYEKIKPKRTHRASAPGQPPATDMGALASRGNYYIRRGKMSATIGSNLAYAAYLEFGTRRIKPRPAWVPAVQENRAKFNDRIREAIRKAAL